MLAVSQDWLDMFKGNVLNKALIKLDIQDNETLYAKDIFSYEFNGEASIVANIYPQYKAQFVAKMNDRYYNYSQYIGKKVDIYYGYVINGVDTYVKALSLYVNDIVISDNGREATFYLISRLALMVDCPDFDLPSLATDIQYYTFSQFLQDYYTDYLLDSPTTYNYRHFAPRTTSGMALQEICFVNGKTLKLTSDNKLSMFTFDYTNVAQYETKINILKYPHIEKMSYPEIVAVSYIDENATNLEIGTAGSCEIIADTQVGTSYRGVATLTINDGNYYTKGTLLSYQKVGGSGDITSVSFGQKTNNQYTISMIATTFATTGKIEINGISYANAIYTENGKTKVFDINILTSAQANYITQWVEEYLSSQKTCELSMRINPAYELLDNLNFGNFSMTIEKLKITFKGAYKGEISGRCEVIAKPLLLSIDVENYTLQIKNNNAFEVKLKIVSSGGEDTFTINGSASPTLDVSGYNIALAFDDYIDGNLTSDVYCYFVSDVLDIESENIIIMEAQV